MANIMVNIEKGIEIAAEDALKWLTGANKALKAAPQVVAALATMRTPFFSTVTSTSACESVSGWHRGIRSDVRFAAEIPAIRAISSGLPLGDFSRRTLLIVARSIRINACACAVRDVGGFSVTSTIRTRPFSS